MDGERTAAAGPFSAQASHTTFRNRTSDYIDRRSRIRRLFVADHPQGIIRAHVKIKEWRRLYKWRPSKQSCVTFLLGMILGSILTQVVESGQSVRQDAPPVMLHTSVKRGEALDVLYSITRSERCISRITWKVWRYLPVYQNGPPVRQIYYLGSIDTPSTHIGKNEVVVSVPLLPAIPAGNWMYNSVISEQCGWLPILAPEHVYVSADIPIVITE